MRVSKLSFLIWILFFGSSFAQVQLNKYTQLSNGFNLFLTFESEPYLFEGESRNIINFYRAVDEGKPGTPILPSKTIYIAIPPESKISLNFSKEKFNFINNGFLRSNPAVELKADSTLFYQNTEINRDYIDKDNFPTDKYFIEGYAWIRDFYCAIVKINTHSYDMQMRRLNELQEAEISVQVYDEKPFKINSSPLGDFGSSLKEIIINFNEAQNFRSFSPNISIDDSTGNWIDYTKEYVKLQIPDEGIYQIGYNQLLSYGINPQSVDPNTLKLFSNGIEIPLFVRGEDDNSFDAGDYIEFWAEKNLGLFNYRNLVTQGEAYLPYLNIYSDTSIVWLTWNGNNGKRADLINNYIPGLTDSVTSHQVKIHLEKDNLLWYYGYEYPRIQLPFWNECKTWIQQQVYHNNTSSFSFMANSIVPNTNIYTISRLNSWFSDGVRQNAHKFGAKLNSTGIQDSVLFDFETIANLEAVFNSNHMTEGTNNYRITGMPNAEDKLHRAVIDWIDIEYFQYTDAVNDSLHITIPDSVSSQQRVIKISNFTSDSASTIIYKIKQKRKKASTFILNGTTITFTDTVKGGDEYLIINNNYINQPVFLEKKEFVNLRIIDKQADYIIITHESLQQSVIEYANFIEANYSELKVETVFIDDINDEFGFGYLRPEPIKEFLKYAYFNWNSPRPTYLVLIGDCTYDYKNLFTSVPTPRKKILVPSFGMPVSDSWFTMWDTSNVNIQQMLVGRIPANNNEEVYSYLDKHEKYIQREFDEWNKHFLLFSGGYPDDPAGMQQIKHTNDGVIENIIHPPPVGGEAFHFYKTISPPSNLGPYTADEIQQALDYGGLFISYVGHSGTRIWDNGVSEPSDVNNAFDDRLPVVSDNGCSTGKFAEPDIDAFGELFVNQDEQGQAIIYTGNSSLGYTSTAYRMPEVFYNRLIVDTTTSIGEAHFLSKMDNFSQAGYNDVNRLYNYCNILFGDPVIKFAFPDKPNYSINQNSVKFDENFITDLFDSVNVKIDLANWGKVSNDSIEVDVESFYTDSIISSRHLLLSSPLFHDTLNLKIPLFDLAGEHILRIELDKNNNIDETEENDNSVEISFIVYSTKIRPIEPELFYNSQRNSVRVLNPTISGSLQLDEIELSISQNSDFINQQLLTQNLDTVFTSILLANQQPDTRFYWRARLKGIEQEWSQTASFYSNHDYSWMINHSFNLSDVATNQVEFDTLSLGWKIKQGTNNLKIASAGFVDGMYASIQYNFLEYVFNPFFRGFATALIDTFDLHPDDVQSFIYPLTPSRDSLINYINYLPEGSVLAITATDEVSAYFSGTVGDSLKQLLKGFGSVYVDSIGWRDSWAMIGIKGALQGSVPEVFSKSLQGPAVIDTSKFVQFGSGTVQFPTVENSIKWLNVFKKDSIPMGAIINYRPLGYRINGIVDTLNILQFVSNEASIEFIDINLYKKISILAELSANNDVESPVIKELAVNFIPPPELGTNYQVVSATEDTVLVGEDIGLSFYVYNVGESAADSFNVNVDVINEDNSRTTIFSQMVETLEPESRQLYELIHNTSTGTGSKTFLIDIDSEKQVRELFEDNNFYTIPFFIKPDTSRPTLQVSFDGGDILDGDYISPNPEIKIKLTDETLLPITDSSAVTIFLNNEPVYYANNQSILSIDFNEQNPKAVVTYTPELEDGEYNLTVFGKNSLGSLVDSSGLEKRFLVSNEVRLLDVYNYPNPTAGETHFTFKLTRIPDEIKIRIFTIAGRLIKELKIPGTDLNYDFNKIYWDGKDEDGDVIGNGVYLYKVILTAGDKTENVIQKLAIVR
ncbi:C25 family cysteine peptidase [Bacteroidota bacterium]